MNGLFPIDMMLPPEFINTKENAVFQIVSLLKTGAIYLFCILCKLCKHFWLNI